MHILERKKCFLILSYYVNKKVSFSGSKIYVQAQFPHRNLCQVVLDVFVLNDTFETFCHVIFYQLKSCDKKNTNSAKNCRQNIMFLSTNNYIDLKAGY